VTEFGAAVGQSPSVGERPLAERLPPETITALIKLAEVIRGIRRRRAAAAQAKVVQSSRLSETYE
jgi:hypothetical protein